MNEHQEITMNELLGAMFFATQHPLNPKQIKAVLKETALTYGGKTEAFATLTVEQIEEAIETFSETLTHMHIGLKIVRVAQGYRMENEKELGHWLRVLLDRGKPQKLSKPALETLAIIAYRQPCTRSEVEQVRGVAVDAIVRSLMEMELIKTGERSDLPGKPWLFETTDRFLEHFGLNNLEDLPNREELQRALPKTELQEPAPEKEPPPPPQAPSEDNPDAASPEPQPKEDNHES